MRKKTDLSDYEPVTRSTVSGVLGRDDTETALRRANPKSSNPKNSKGIQAGRSLQPSDSDAYETSDSVSTRTARHQVSSLVKRGHAISYAGLFLFTVIVFFRPYEVFPSLSWTLNSAFWIGIATLVVFLPTQLLTEGKLTARPREVNLVMLFSLLALLSIPLATDPKEAWEIFSTQLIKVVVIFVVIVNVVRTRFRLRALLLLALVISVYVSINAINDYRLGRLEAQGVRIEGSVGGMLLNPNDLALYLVTIAPITVGLLLSTHGILKKTLYATSVLLMLAGIIVTFSRGGFIGLVAALAVLAWKLRRTHRNGVMIIGTTFLVLFLVLAPGKYGNRIESIFGTDPTGSADQRKDLLVKSFLVSLRHPLLGVGMGNFHIYSAHEQVSHNSYTQVSSEMGLTAALIYTMFIISPLLRLRRIQEETIGIHRKQRSYFVALGLQASLIGYMFASFFVSVAYLWYVYYLVGYAMSLHQLHIAEQAMPNLQRTNNS